MLAWSMQDSHFCQMSRD